MSVDDNWGEAIRKSTEEVTPGDKSEYQLRTRVVGGTLGIFPAGLHIAFKVTTLLVTDVPAPIPPTALDKRNALAILNQSPSVALFIGPTPLVTADSVVGTTSGWEVGPRESFQLDISNDIPLYVCCPSGQTALVKVLELS